MLGSKIEISYAQKLLYATMILPAHSTKFICIYLGERILDVSRYVVLNAKIRPYEVHCTQA